MTDIRTTLSDIIASDDFVVQADYTQDAEGLRFQFIDVLIAGLTMNGLKIVPISFDDEDDSEAEEDDTEYGC